MNRIKSMLVAVASLATVACGDSSTSASATLAGTWNMTSVNGSSLPYTIQAANPKIEILNEQIIFSSAGTYTVTGNGRITSGGTVTNQPITDSGTLKPEKLALRYSPFLRLITGISPKITGKRDWGIL